MGDIAAADGAVLVRRRGRRAPAGGARRELVRRRGRAAHGAREARARSRLVVIAPGLPTWDWSEEMRDYWAAEEAAWDAGDFDLATQVNLDFWVKPEHHEEVRPQQRRAFELQSAHEEPELQWPEMAPLETLAIPTLVVVGEDDKTDFRAIAQHLAEHIPDSELAVVPAPAISSASTGRTSSTRCFSRSCPNLSLSRGQSPGLGRFCQDRVGQARPRLGRPVAEREIGEARERNVRVRVDPQERAAAAEMPERPRRVARARPMRRLRVAQLEAEPPVVRLLPAEARQHADEPGELHRARLLERLRRDARRLAQLAREHEQIVERPLHARARRAGEDGGRPSPHVREVVGNGIAARSSTSAAATSKP